MGKYQQTRKDRRDESRGMKKAEGGEMISKDYSAPANMPQNVIHKTYPKNSYAGDETLNDSPRGIDESIQNSVKKIKNNRSSSMY